MYKILFLVFNFFIFPFLLIAQNFSIIGERITGPYPTAYSIVIIDEHKMSLEWTSKDSETSNDRIDYFNYSMEQRDGMTFLVLDADIPKELLLGEYEQLGITDNAPLWEIGSEILILVGRINKRLIDRDTVSYYNPTFFLGYAENPVDENINAYPFLEDIYLSEGFARSYRDVSSFLSEFGRVYDVSELNYFGSERAWVEGVSGDGIGEGFVIENRGEKTKWNTLLIINGFISARNPRLYKENGRVKKIKVEGVESGVSKVLDIIDTPHAQTVDISFLPKPEDIRVTIADVYPGTKYKDTAIHYCITYEYKVVPLFP